MVQRREHDIESLEDPVRKIQTAVRHDVHFASVQDRDVGDALPQCRDLLGLGPDCLRGQRARGPRLRRVVGHGDVLVSQVAARPDHRFDRVAAVAPHRVHVQIAADVLPHQQAGQLTTGRHVDFLVAVPNFGRDEGQPERRVDLGLGGGRAQRAVRRPQTVGRQLPSPLGGARLQRTIVRRRAGQTQQDRPGVAQVGKADTDLRAIHHHIQSTGAPDGAVDRRRERVRSRPSRPTGSSTAATISMSPTVSSARRSDPAVSAQCTPGDDRI